ncbi:MAG: hypothetical protein KDJ87_22195, partial [Rhizobiaceae bacterium]|nr:hypothetical protein [Rhizobiaceae bacterium]
MDDRNVGDVHLGDGLDRLVLGHDLRRIEGQGRIIGLRALPLRCPDRGLGDSGARLGNGFPGDLCQEIGADVEIRLAEIGEIELDLAEVDFQIAFIENKVVARLRLRPGGVLPHSLLRLEGLRRLRREIPNDRRRRSFDLLDIDRLRLHAPAGRIAGDGIAFDIREKRVEFAILRRDIARRRGVLGLHLRLAGGQIVGEVLVHEFVVHRLDIGDDEGRGLIGSRVASRILGIGLDTGLDMFNWVELWLGLDRRRFRPPLGVHGVHDSLGGRVRIFPRFRRAVLRDGRLGFAGRQFSLNRQDRLVLFGCLGVGGGRDRRVEVVFEEGIVDRPALRMRARNGRPDIRRVVQFDRDGGKIGCILMDDFRGDRLLDTRLDLAGVESGEFPEDLVFEIEDRMRCGPFVDPSIIG